MGCRETVGTIEGVDGQALGGTVGLSVMVGVKVVGHTDGELGTMEGALIGA